MRKRIEALREAFPPKTLHAVAVKANPVLEILREVVQAGAGLEAASIEEVELALAAGCPPERVVFDSPAKTVNDIQIALRSGVYLNADNFDELRRIDAVLQSQCSTSLIGLRVNTMVGSGTIQQTSVSQSNSKFGVPLLTDQANILAAFAKYHWLNGLHVHVGSQGCSLALLAEAVNRIAALRHEIALETGRRISQIDIGGGLPTAYRTGDVAPSPAEYRYLLEKSAPDLFCGDDCLTTEFGRAIQANCGLAISRVEYIKPAQQLAVLHLGADFLMRPVYRPEDWHHEFFVLDRTGRPKSGPARTVTFAGPLCFAGDIVARNASLSPVDEGDWIVVRDVGAYTLSMWSRHCSRSMPAVIGYDASRADSLRILRRAETPRDIVRFWALNDLENEVQRGTCNDPHRVRGTFGAILN
jgi:diaminopimelate decarboxylase